MQNSDNNEKNPQKTEEFQITITSEVKKRGGCEIKFLNILRNITKLPVKIYKSLSKFLHFKLFSQSILSWTVEFVTNNVNVISRCGFSQIRNKNISLRETTVNFASSHFSKLPRYAQPKTSASSSTPGSESTRFTLTPTTISSTLSTRRGAKPQRTITTRRATIQSSGSNRARISAIFSSLRRRISWRGLTSSRRTRSGIKCGVFPTPWAFFYMGSRAVVKPPLSRY